MLSERIINRICVFLRIVFGIVFLFSAFMKLTDVQSFENALGSFKLLSDNQIVIVAYLIPIVETVLGLCLLLNVKISFTIQLTTFMLVMFTAIIVAKLFEGEEVNCGCFGSLTTDKIDITTVIRNVILIIWGMSISVFYNVNNSIGENGKSKVIKKAVFTHLKNLSFVVVFFFLAFQTFIFALQNRELKNRLYLLMSDKEILQKGEVAKTFYAYNLQGDEIKFDNTNTGNKKTLLFLFSVNCEPCKINMPNWNSLVDKLRNEKLNIIGVSMDSLSSFRNYSIHQEISFPIYSAPQIEFKISYKGFITPQTILIDTDGKVINAWAGQLNAIKIDNLLQSL